MSSRVVVVIAVLLAGCKGKPPADVSELTPADDDVVMEMQSGELPRLADALTDDQVHGCTSDDDCGLTAHVDGTCCDRLCGSVDPYRQSFIDQLDAQRTGDACAGARCPIASCAPGAIEHVAKCVEGECIDDRVDHTGPLFPPDTPSE